MTSTKKDSQRWMTSLVTMNLTTELLHFPNNHSIRWSK